MSPVEEEVDEGSGQDQLLPLTGYVLEGQFARVDPDVYAWAKAFHWRAFKDRTPYRLVARDPKTGSTLNLARLITQAGPREFPRFKDGNGLNCTRANLELVDNCDEASRPSPEEIMKNPERWAGVYEDALARLSVSQASPIMRWAARDDFRSSQMLLW